ncbi:hypothetical protein TgHK011_002057 [Trichoderma gracile]|nr:hypothetical protein TgHK011_002057 [Trichoderma gracile]
MQAIASPTKRRAVLGSLDANAAMGTPGKKVAAAVVVVAAREEEEEEDHAPVLRLAAPSASLTSGGVVVSSAGERGGGGESPAAKKACVDESTRSSSPSVETSSVFDSSSMTTTTAITEPAPSTTRPRTMTREQAREKAEILRLRLGLAGYKLRTGQTSVPLSQLQRKPLPPPASTDNMRRRANTCTSTERTSTHTRDRSVHSIPPGVPSLSQESSSSSSSTASDVVVVMSVAASASSQESVIAETRGNTPARDGDAGGERDKGGLLLTMGDVDSPSRMFHSSPVPAPVSSLRSTCA